MALSGNTVFEVRLTGSDTNGGGFVTGATGTDWSQQDTAQYAVTDGVTNGTTTITSATAAFGTDVVGNIMYVQGGTGAVAAGWYQIISRTDATTVVVDRSTGLTAGTGVTLNIGGALASPGQAAAIATVTNMKVFIKYNASPYVITTASTNVSGGCVSVPTNTHWAGYDTDRRFFAPPQNRPTLQLNSGVTSATIFGNLNSFGYHQHLILDGNLQTGSSCYWTSGDCYYIKVMNGVLRGMQNNVTSQRAFLCEATGCLAVPMSTPIAVYCVSHDNALTVSTNQNALSTGYAHGCISYGNNTNGFSISAHAFNCVSYDNDHNGMTCLNSGGCVFVNCISEGNGTYGFAVNTGNATLVNCASYNNTSGRNGVTSGGGFWHDDINGFNLTGSAFTNAAAQDFSLNNTAGAGADLRAAGFPSVFLGLNNYRDVGSLQHQDTGGGGGTGISRARGASGF